MKTQNLPAKLLAVVGILFACGAVATGAMLPVANVARDYSPRSIVEANATATAAPVALEPTRTYQERVLPIQQAVEAQEIVETTQTQYANARTASDVWLWMRAAGAIIMMCGVLVFVGSASVERIKRAREYEPIQVLPNKPLYFPRRAHITHPLTGATWSVALGSGADVQHGTLLIESGAGARFRVTGRNEARHPEWQPVVVDALRLGEG